MSGFARRLPVYLLLDCSGSMHGEPIEAVKQGVKSLLSELRSDPQALETAYLSVITFDSTARQVSPLTELMQFQEPSIQAGGATALGEALEVLKDSIQREVRKTTDDQKGDWKPLVFILTDGAPTDTQVFDRAVDNIKDMGAANIIACGAGSNVDTSLLKRITPNVILLNSASPGDLAEFFKWVSSSIAMSSASLDAKPGDAIALPPVPSNVFYVVP